MLTHGIQLRTNNDDLVVYKPVFIPSEAESRPPTCLQFFRESHHTLSKLASNQSIAETEIPQRRRPLRALRNVSGLSTVFVPGDSGRFVVKTAKSSPHVVRLRGEFTRWLSGFDSPATGCGNGFIYVDSEVRATF